MYLAGRRVRGTIGWPPESGNVGLGLSIISYDGELVVGLLADTTLVGEPRALLDDITAELAGSLGTEVPAGRADRPSAGERHGAALAP